jgi:hypothetical protein
VVDSCEEIGFDVRHRDLQRVEDDKRYGDILYYIKEWTKKYREETLAKEQIICDRLLWLDVPEGDLHECLLNCDHLLNHQNRQSKCWEGLLPTAFSRGWIAESRRNAKSYRPDNLPEGSEYLEIDFRILMAFLISTIGCNRNIRSIVSGFTAYKKDGQFVFDAGGAERIQLKFREDCIIAHVWGSKCRPWTPTGDRNVRSWTKAEIENLLNGYPPFYSEMIALHEDQTRVPFPIHSPEDIQKGGWVLAAKLGNITNPLPLYFESQPATTDSLRKPTFQLATEWVRDMLKGPFMRAFPNDKNVIAALKALNFLCDGQKYISCALEGSDLSEDAPSSLSTVNAIKAMDIFNRPTLMTASERDILREDAELILVPLLSAAVFGVRDVLGFESQCVEFKTKLPPALRPSSKIFLRDCSKFRPYDAFAGDGWTSRGGGW